MTKERKLLMAALVIEATELDDFYVDIEVGTCPCRIYTNNFRVSPHKCAVYIEQDEKHENTNIEYIYDPDLEQAEEYIRGILEEMKNDAAS